MHIVTGVCGAAVGAGAGPALAALSVRVPRGRVRRAGLFSGVPATRRRRMLVTLLAVVVLGVLGARLGWSADLPAFGWFAAAGVVLSVIDIDCHRLPNMITYPSYVAGLALLGLAAGVRGDAGAYERALIAMAAVLVVFVGMAVFGGVGLGDAKLAGIVALHLGWLSWNALAIGLVAGFAVGALAALPRIAARRLRWRSEIAFGPALLLGALIGAVAVG